ncbi:MAG: glycerophosphodiester phosphodiesterase [Desulfobacteraceae bacterium]|nr:glycerophosphodiester phosphodiesterase [Desulfobacteraceae bacterium]
MIEIIAHRGARSLAPENTLAAARLAWKIGAHRWETDVNLTRDGHLVLFHDKIHSTMAELATLDLGSVFLSTDPFSTISQGKIKEQELSSLKGEGVPTLDQGLILTRDLDFRINIELKDYGNEPVPYFIVTRTLDSIKKTGISPGSVTISSFNHDWLKWLSPRAPEIEIQALVGDDGVFLDFHDFSFPVYNVNAKLVTDSLLGELKARGKRVNLFTINEPREFARFVDAGVDGIFTDFPQRFVTLKRI